MKGTRTEAIDSFKILNCSPIWSKAELKVDPELARGEFIFNASLEAGEDSKAPGEFWATVVVE